MFAAKMPPTRRSLATIRPLRYELAGRCLPRYARSHSCRSATFSRSTCLAPSRLFASVLRCSVSKSVANPLSDKDSRAAASVAFSWVIVADVGIRSTSSRVFLVVHRISFSHRGRRPPRSAPTTTTACGCMARLMTALTRMQPLWRSDRARSHRRSSPLSPAARWRSSRR
jgi:hypothetical protein